MKRLSAGLLVAAVAIVWLLPLDPVATDLTDRFAAPSLVHPLGTDHLGRDVLARLIDGAWISVGLTAVALVVCALLGTAAGVLSGYAGGVAAGLVQRAVDVLVAIPTIVVGLVVAAVREPGTGTLLLAVLVTGWSPFARLAHHLTLRERAREYVEGAVAIGAGPVRIAVRHVLPNALRPLIAHACLRFANVLLSIAGLSFLGLGVQPPTPEWGVMLAEGRQFMFLAPQLVLLPATAIVLAATCVTVLGRRLERHWSGT
ncbi:peptide/nickel transport system permease protein [Pseudonocardia hierapolitana]|uniref:Peptide/nickel transport system permease protein n=1 Tax=Pseudonocardia hierapolitana TaxID=1128676 RepID=A0A561SS61_9PSEU|nr:ABC transporter permease [Pseudonocardia hierapolitana]TWF77683.1 peptide/nickel transport system permease protein [Pseudonocardia hierapolitana]